MRPPSSQLVRATLAALTLTSVVAACGGAPAAVPADHAAAAEPAEPEVTKEQLAALETRVLELEIKVKNLQVAGVTGDPFAPADGVLGVEGTAGGGEQPEWSYDDPDGWGELGAAYSTCSTGKEQSPIDLVQGAALAADIANPVIDYGDTDAATIVDTGQTIEVGVSGVGTLGVEGVSYDLKQVHFHAPSEHTIGGVHAPLEVHFVHSTVEGVLAVVAALVQAGPPSPGYDPIIAALPQESAEPAAAKEIGTPIAFRSLLPQQTVSYRYLGSLTAPPCTEGVSWLVLSTPLTMSQAQIDTIVAALPQPNNRPVQALEGRVVGLDVTP